MVTSRVRLLPLLVILLLTACDSSDPDSNNTSASDVKGVYSFTNLSFDPNAPGIPMINLLDTLETSQTKLFLFEDNNFILTYQYHGGNTVPIQGVFAVNELELRLTGPANSTDEVTNLLLNSVAVLKRDPGDQSLLSATLTNQTIDVGLFLREFKDTNAEGTIRLQLHR